ncbi:hypothetical protein KY329_05085, partial [Candidatus Woesearchaeota archaeon]|nr:hypothetical protein [Candidatus Woesearchaeota archaeon]
GKEETKTILPSQPVYELEINKTKKLHRFQPLNRKQAFRQSDFKEIFGKYPAVRDVVFNFDRFPWKYRILNITDDGYVIAEMALRQGERYQLPSLPWNSTVFEVYTDVVTFFHDPREGQIIKTEFGDANVTTTGKSVFINYMPVRGQKFEKSMSVGGVAATQEFKVINVTDKSFTIRRIGILEDKTLELTATVKNITKSVKEIKPDRIKGKTTIVAQ